MPLIVLQVLAALAATVTITTGLVKLVGHILKLRREAREARLRLQEQAAREEETVGEASFAAPEASALPFNNLPSPLNNLIGREQERRTLDALLEEGARLITLVGPGGVGKTRLAIEVGHELADEFTDGVAFVSLANVRDPQLVAPTIARTLGLRESESTPAIETLKAYLRAKQMLLILDNFEGVAGAAPQLAELLEACPLLTVLVTSRAVLHLRGERQIPVLPLPVPPASGPLEEIAANESVSLFVQRARATNPSFNLTETNAAHVAEICRRLEGLPLAIELAAARTRLLTPQHLLERLNDGFALLTGGSPEVVRQQTLRNTLAWSYDLLPEPEKVLFRRMGIFAGGVSLKAAEDLADVLTAGDAPALLERMASLVDNSLVVQQEVDGAARFHMMEIVREYAVQQMEACCERQQIAEAHALYFQKLAEQAESELRGPEQVRWTKVLDLEVGNVRAAFDWLLDSGRAQDALSLMGSLRWFWAVRGMLAEGKHLIRRALAAAGSEDRTLARAKALLALGIFAVFQGLPAEARFPLEESIRILREIDDKGHLAEAIGFLGNALENSLDPQASDELYAQSLALHTEAGDTWGTVHMAMTRGLGDFFRHQTDKAKKHFEQALTLATQAGDAWTAAYALNHLGDVARYKGDYEKAGQLYDESLARFRAQGQQGPLASLMHNFGHIALSRGDYDDAANKFLQSLEMHRAQDDRRGMAEALNGLAAAIGRAGDWKASAEIFGAAESMMEAAKSKIWPSNVPDYKRNVAAIQQRSGDEPAFLAAWQRGRDLSLEEALTLAKRARLPEKQRSLDGERHPAQQALAASAS